MNIPNVVCLIVGLVAFLLAIWQLGAFATAKDAAGIPDIWAGTNNLLFGLLALGIACVCAVYYFVRNKKEVEEIHITDRG
ncbi:MAG TPA: hypothetical protein VEQ42_11280 [Pyrinomonadaceae bacterium]|nr:hypothetical protein [Pyrinomonadaceae bacterium]